MMMKKSLARAPMAMAMGKIISKSLTILRGWRVRKFYSNGISSIICIVFNGLVWRYAIDPSRTKANLQGKLIPSTILLL